MLKQLGTLIIALFVMIILDYIWLGIVARNHYHHTLGHLMRLDNDKLLQPIWLSVIAVYMVMSIGLCYFVVANGDSVKRVLGRGAVYGFVLYGTYEFTNYAILKHWPASVILPDLLWGTFLMALTGAIAYLFKTRIHLGF